MRLLIATLLCSSAVFAADPWVGTWKLDKAKSSNLPAGMASAKEYVRIVKPKAPHGYESEIKITDAEGKVTDYKTEGQLDGKEHPAIFRATGKIIPGYTSIEQELDDHHQKTVYKKDGKDFQFSDVVVSGDGRTVTDTRTGKSLQGETIHQIMVWDKQP